MKLRPWLLHQFKKKSRVYIMPTKMGGYLNGLIFLMFLLSVGYSNNLLLIFTLFLFGLNLIWVIQTHFHLHKLKLLSFQIDDQFAGEKTLVRLYWKNSPKAPVKWQIELHGLGFSFKVESISDSESQSEGQILIPNRGVKSFEHVKIKTEMPFGLYQAWIYLPASALVYTYPELLKNAPPMRQNLSLYEGENSSFKVGPHDIWNLGPYQGEESRKINWKHYARSGELVVKEGEELTKSEVIFKLIEMSDNKELYLSKLATQMVQCARSDSTFILVALDQRKVRGLQDCLRELAQCL